MPVFAAAFSIASFSVPQDRWPLAVTLACGVGIGALILLSRKTPEIPRKHWPVWIPVCWGGALTLAFAPGQIQSALVLMGSLVAGQILYVLVRRSNPDELRIFHGFGFLSIWVLAMVQALELDGGALRSAVFALHDVSLSAGQEHREASLTLLGNPRPIGLMQEPSYLSMYMYSTGAVLLLLRSSIVPLVAALSVFAFLNPSPLLLLALPALVTAVGTSVRETRFRLLLVMVGLGLLAVLLAFAWPGETSPLARVQRLMSGEATLTSSEGLRVLYPYVLLTDLELWQLMFGVGIGNLQPWMHLAFEGERAFVQQSALATLIGSFGVVGLVVFLYGLTRGLCLRSKLFFALLFVLMAVGSGGAYLPRMWVPLFVALAVLANGEHRPQRLRRLSA